MIIVKIEIGERQDAQMNRTEKEREGEREEQKKNGGKERERR